tara:strand:- start:354 stop:1640 length:1287 start_codon:yes stop_codon:yes gene_type:complete
VPFIKNDNKHNRRVFIKNIFTGSFGLALGVVVGCSDNSASNISKDTKSNTQSPDSATQPLQKTSQPTVVKPSQPTVVEPSKPTVVEPSQPTVVEPSKPINKTETIKDEQFVSSTKMNRDFKPKFKGPHYVGPLFESHLHMPELVQDDSIKNTSTLDIDVTAQEIINYLNKEKVDQAIAFSLPNPQKFQEYYTIANKFRDVDAIKLFVGYPGPYPQMLENILSMSNGLYKGLGELGFYTYPLKGTPPDAPQMSALYNIIGKNKMIVMLHPDNGQTENVRNMLRRHPDVKFLFHGNEICYDIDSIISEFDNAYFSIDSAVFFTTVYTFSNRMPRIKPLYGVFMSGPVEKFVNDVGMQYYDILNDNIDFWKPKIVANPTKYLWGTDKFLPWHWTEDASQLFEEFARAFTGALPKQVQEMYAHTNGINLLNS